MPVLKKIVKWSAYIAVAVVVLTFSAADPESDASSIFAYVIAAILLIPAGILLLLQLSFWAYHALMHGDPFYDPAVDAETRRNRKDGQRGIISLDMYTFSRKKMCPVCKRMTRCKVGGTKPGQIPYHIHRA